MEPRICFFSPPLAPASFSDKKSDPRTFFSRIWLLPLVTFHSFSLFPPVCDVPILRLCITFSLLNLFPHLLKTEPPFFDDRDTSFFPRFSLFSFPIKVSRSPPFCLPDFLYEYVPFTPVNQQLCPAFFSPPFHPVYCIYFLSVFARARSADHFSYNADRSGSAWGPLFPPLLPTV